jgi:hypothetical protein
VYGVVLQWPQGSKTKGKRTRDGKSEDALKKARKLNQLGAGTIKSAT